MHSSIFRRKQFIVSLIIFLIPITAIANLSTPGQQYEGTYLQEDEEIFGALPSLEASDHPGFVEQTYPIDEHYAETKKG